MNRLTALPILLCLVAATATANDLHPNFPILDQQGQAVIASGQPMSTMQTCGGCHDTAFIEASSDHADAGASQPGNTGPDHPWEAGPGYYGGWDPIRYEADVLDDDGNVLLRLESGANRYNQRMSLLSRLSGLRRRTG